MTLRDKYEISQKIAEDLYDIVVESMELLKQNYSNGFGVTSEDLKNIRAHLEVVDKRILSIEE